MNEQQRQESFQAWLQQGGGLNSLNYATEIAKIAYNAGLENGLSEVKVPETVAFPAEPILIKGGLASDDRGSLSFINNFSLLGFKRFYIIENNNQLIRAWHGHRHESKVFIPIIGSWKVVLLNLETEELNGTYVLSDKSPAALFVPGGFYNGTMNLTNGARLLVLSNASLDESKDDDIRKEYVEQGLFNTVIR